jgi:hypothetical protein
MNLIFISSYDDLTDEDVEFFWKQDVNMDDWDYIILAPVASIEEVDATDWNGKSIKKYVVCNYNLERLLTGCCDNKWYRATFRGVEYAVGVAYHA